MSDLNEYESYALDIQRLHEDMRKQKEDFFRIQQDYTDYLAGVQESVDDIRRTADNLKSYDSDAFESFMQAMNDYEDPYDGEFYSLVTPKERKLTIKTSLMAELRSFVTNPFAGEQETFRDTYVLQLFGVDAATAVDLYKVVRAGLGPQVNSRSTRDFANHFAEGFASAIDNGVTGLLRHRSAPSSKNQDNYSTVFDVDASVDGETKSWAVNSSSRGAHKDRDLRATLKQAEKRRGILRFDYVRETPKGQLKTTRRVKLLRVKYLKDGSVVFTAERRRQIKTYRLDRCSNMFVESNPGRTFVPESEISLVITDTKATLWLNQSTR